jgi:predicted class III extradiol MEMO1 family dioxygenase
MGVAVIELCDGTRTRDEVCAEFQARYRVPLERTALSALLTRLDQALLLDSAAFRNHAARTFADFAQSPTRPASFAGKSYPKDEGALRQQLDGFFSPPNGPGLPVPGSHLQADTKEAPAAIIAPHVDFTRGGPAYAWAYRPLLVARTLPDLIVLLGTDHGAPDPGFTLLRKHFETPLGELQTDLTLVDELLEDARGHSAKLPESLLRDEYHHRGEHSLEFQAVWLRYVLDRRSHGQDQGTAPLEKPPLVLPILCGSLHDFVVADGPAGPETTPRTPPGPALPCLDLLRDRVAQRRAAGQRVLFVGAADLAHVGPRYGDKDPLSKADCDSLERRDRETLQKVLAGDADGWFHELRRERDRRRVCGLAPIYALLKVAELEKDRGSLRCYGQCPAEAGSIVSIASVVF